jgi:lipopolysaccharide export system permease protein
MRIVDRYMTKGFLGPLVWCLLLFTVMAVIIDVFSFIEDIVKYNIPVTSIIAFYVYYCPTIIIQVTPMAVLLSTIYLLSNLHKHNEIIAMKSSGINLWRVLAPLLVIGLLVSVFTYIINDKIIPSSSKISNTIRREELERDKPKEARQKVLQNVAIYGFGNRIVFAKSYDTENRVLSDIIIHEHDINANLKSKITAASGEWTGKNWKFTKVIRYKIDNSGEILQQPEFFEEKILPIRERPSDFANREWKSECVSYAELKRYIRNFKGGSHKFISSLLVDLHYKVSFCFINLIIILVSAPFALISTRGGVLVGVGMSIAIGLLYYAVISIALAFGKGGLLPPFLAAWFGNIIFAGVGIHLINKRN